MFDIAAADFVPEAGALDLRAVPEAHGVEPTRAALFEDIARNLAVPHDLGMATVLVVPKIADPYREAFEQEAVREAAYRPHHRRPRDLPAACVLPEATATDLANRQAGGDPVETRATHNRIAEILVPIAHEGRNGATAGAMP